MPVRFLALTPDLSLTQLIADHKQCTRELAGPQLYLDDAPHLTVYLAAFPASVSLLELATPLQTLPAPRVRLIGWHAFVGDALTGLNTLTCEIHQDDKQALRGIQARVLDLVAAQRDASASSQRFQSRMTALTPLQQDSVERFGFPYTGDGWEPHFTIASIRPADWPVVFRGLSQLQPTGDYCCSRLEEYELDGLVPHRLGGFEFAGGVLTPPPLV